MSEWISVKDKLPSDCESVIAYRKNIGATNMFYDKHEDAWEQDGYGDIGEMQFKDVTHWMPLPEPPQ